MRQRLISGFSRIMAGIRSTPPHRSTAEHHFPADEPLADLPLTILDTETTGLNVARDRVLSIGALLYRGTRPEPSPPLDLLVHPGIPIPKRATAIHGIGNSKVAYAPSLALLWPSIQARWQGRALLGHNIAFDLAVLRHEAERARLPFLAPSAALDIGLLYAGLRPRKAHITLEAMARDLGVEVIGRHDALGDAKVTAEIWVRLMPALGHIGVATLGAAQHLMARQRDLVHGQGRAGWSIDLLLPRR